jgi:hypothetical protein
MFPEGWDRMLSFGGDRNVRKRASFRLGGALLDPDAITRATGLTPDLCHKKGNPHIGSGGREYAPWPNGLWSLSSEHAVPASRSSLDDHLAWLLDQLEPHVEVLRQICAEQQLSADFYCGYFMGQSNSGFELSGATLRRVVALGLGASVGVDIYGERVETELELWVKDAKEAAES